MRVLAIRLEQELPSEPMSLLILPPSLEGVPSSEVAAPLAPWLCAQHRAGAGLGERTFLRRFKGATGLNPLAYLQLLRVGRARELLERSLHSVDEIAYQVGYEDVGAFRKVFRRLLGLSPGEYRRRFACGPPRAS